VCDGFFSLDLAPSPKFHDTETAFVLLSVNWTESGAFPVVGLALNSAFVTVGAGTTSPEVRNVYSWLPGTVVMMMADLSVDSFQPVYALPSFSSFPMLVFIWNNET
jgi:hypothetical protein